MIGGIAIQTYNGYLNLKSGHYLFELYAIKIHFVIWAAEAAHENAQRHRQLS
jgi:hypothetical protein